MAQIVENGGLHLYACRESAFGQRVGRREGVGRTDIGRGRLLQTQAHQHDLVFEISRRQKLFRIQRLVIGHGRVGAGRTKILDQGITGSGCLRFAFQAERLPGETVLHRRHAAQIGIAVEMHGGHAGDRAGIQERIERADPSDLDSLRQRCGHVVRRQHHIRAERLCESRIGFLGGRVGKDDVEGDHLRACCTQAFDQLGVKLPRPGPALTDLADGRLVDGHDHRARLRGERRCDD
jgi:hypothetical protein